jgi:hypothetical protein
MLATALGALVWLRARPAPAEPLPDGMPMLQWAMAACYGVNRVGKQTTVVTAGDKQVESLVELSYRRPGMTHLRYLNGPSAGVEVWEDRNRVYRYVPADGRLEVTPAEPERPLKLEQRLELVRENYTASVEGMEPILGRSAYRIAIRSRHPGNPWKRRWIDEKSCLILASEDYAPDGRLLRATRFTSLDLRTEPESEFRPRPALLKRKVDWNPSADEAPRPPSQVERQVGFAIRLPEYVPPGYRLRGSFVVPCHCGGGDDAVQTRYVDGLNMISVFQCGHPCEHGDDRGGAATLQGSALRRILGNDTFLFVSDIVRSELEKMADSIPPPRGG